VLGHVEVDAGRAEGTDDLGESLVDGSCEPRRLVDGVGVRMRADDLGQRIALDTELEDVEAVAAQERERARPSEVVPESSSRAIAARFLPSLQRTSTISPNARIVRSGKRALVSSISPPTTWSNLLCDGNSSPMKASSSCSASARARSPFRSSALGSQPRAASSRAKTSPWPGVAMTSAGSPARNPAARNAATDRASSERSS
jgi:hypothetical protein